MSEATVTLTLPPEVYAELQERADRHHRPLEDEAGWMLAVAVGASASPEEDPATLVDRLQALDNDLALADQL